MDKQYIRDLLFEIDEHCQAGLNSSDPKHWEAALKDIMAFVRAEDEALGEA